ncbi:MAG TPA: NAD(P)-dependent oxidoreductase [Roseiflexaceae bacterium]|nr:NAD(P)-dependent oxidoreductase [Roseiflexaceae bacterium]
MSEANRILVTGATGKAGRLFIDRVLDDPRYDGWSVRALCHNRMLDPRERLEVVSGSIEHRAVVEQAMQDVTHVVHMATSKETPESIMDVAIKGMFWLLESCRTSPSFRQFIMIGGDAGMGHFIYPQPIPVTETQKHMAYQGCYALSKVLEEVMLEQYYIQYDLNGCCLRAPWIMEKDDLKYTLSFGEDVFGGPRWRELVGPEQADEYIRTRTVPVMLDAEGGPMRRNFVHLSDLIDALLLAIDHPKARQQTFNICMDEPVDYRKIGDYLARTRGYNTVEIQLPHYSTWLDNTKAKFLLGWHPRYDLERLIDAAFDYQRAADDPRIIWYPG